jgi:sulfur carrier protein
MRTTTETTPKASVEKPMNITVNGKEEKIEPGSIESYVRGLGLDPKTVVVEHNRQVIPAEEWTEITLSHGDQLEILCFVGGG